MKLCNGYIYQLFSWKTHVTCLARQVRSCQLPIPAEVISEIEGHIWQRYLKEINHREQNPKAGHSFGLKLLLHTKMQYAYRIDGYMDSKGLLTNKF